MNRDLKRLLESTEGDGPSDDFRARLRAEIVAETEDRNGVGRIPNIGTQVAEVDDGSTAVIELEHPDPVLDLTGGPAEPSPRSPLLGVAAAVIAVAVGLWVLTQNNNFEVDTVEVPADTTTTVVDDELVSDASETQQLTGGNIFFEPGAFRVDTLGTEFTFEVEETMSAPHNKSGVLAIAAARSENADDRTITFRRTSVLPDAAAPTALLDLDDGWPANDFAAWLANLSDDVTAGSPTMLTLGGLDAVFAELSFACDGTEVCQPGQTVVAGELPFFTAGSNYRVWVVDQDDEDPIVIIVAIDDDSRGDLAWLDQADDLLASLKFGEATPNPVRRELAGPLQLEVFEGVQLNVDSAVRVVEPYEGFARLSSSTVGIDLEFLTRPLDIDGVEITSTEHLLEILQNEAIVTSEIETVDISGVDTTAVAFDAGWSPKVVLKTRTADLARPEFGWNLPQKGHLWILEHPDRGLLVIASTTWDDSFELVAVQQTVEAMLPTIEFEDS